MARFVVTPAPRAALGRSYESDDLRDVVDHVRAASASGRERMAIWIEAPPPERGPDAVVVVPLGTFDEWEARAAEVVDEWDERWLLIASTDARHRAAARAALVDGVVIALLVAACCWVDDPNAELQVDPGP